jgi:tetratricopeptide (TPR) repeat protein
VFHNYVIAGEHVLFSAHSGINFFLGNNAQANGYPKIPQPLRADQKGMLQDSIIWAERAVGHPLRRVEVSAFWSSLANQYIHQHPFEWLRLEITKLANFWNAFRYDDLGILTPMREDRILLPGAGFGLMATLALPGALLAFSRWKAARWIVFAVLLHMASVLTVFVTERYRMACVPGLLLLGSAGIVMLGQDLARSRWRPALIYAAVLVPALFLVWWPAPASLRDVDDLNSSIGDLEQNRLDAAQRKLERLYHDHPDNAEVAFGLGNLWLARGDRDRAKALYRRTIQIDPQHDRALNNLGALAVQEKRWPLAEAFLSMSLQIEPDDAKTDFLLAQVRRERNDLPGARQAIDAAMHLRPGVPAFQQFSQQLAAQQ